MKIFDKENKRLTSQFENICWIPESGYSENELYEAYEALMAQTKDLSHDLVKAKTFEMILDKSRIALDTDDIFQDKIFAGNLILEQRDRWDQEIKSEYLAEETAEMHFAASECGAYIGHGDYGHTSPNSRLLLEVGFPGLLSRVEAAKAKGGLTENQQNFYEACIITLRAILRFLHRMADAIAPYNEENAAALRNLTQGAPQNTYEAMQLLISYFFLHEYVGATRVRTLGRLDILLYPFYQKDLAENRFTKEELTEMLKFFLNKFWTAKVPYDLPLCLGGLDPDGKEVTNEFSELFVHVYNSMDIHSPKIHIRVSEKTPKNFLKLVLSCIRGGNSSFVFVNDDVTIKALTAVGIAEKDALDYVPIGCYEPAVWGKEIGCTGNGCVNLAKATELVFTGGVDFKSGKQLTIDTGKPQTFDAFLDAIKAQITYMTERATNYIKKIERHYRYISPDPLLSVMYEDSIRKGVDVFEGGATYNNTSLYGYSIASLVDSVMAVKHLIYDEKKLSQEALFDILKNNWEGQEALRTYIRQLPCKYGNNHTETDAITKELAEHFAVLVNNRPNSRGGVFKAALFSIDNFVYYGKRTMATPDGRFHEEPLSKNLCASIGMDKNGITGLIHSVTQFDHAKFPNGSVLDVLLHPSAVQGENGLDAFYAILRTYMNKGGFAMHGNIFRPEDLKNAQKHPEQYQNLQVRVCGWNAYFVKLSKEEQDAFIRQAEYM